MSKILKALTVGSAALLASGGALAATPYSGPFAGDGFGIDNSLSITGTTLSVACPPTAALCVNFEGGNGVNGIIQRRVVMPDGTNYLQSIVAEGDGVSNLFASEQVVRMGVNGGNSAGNGAASTNIAQKMKILESSGTASTYSTDHTMLGAEYYGTDQGDTICNTGTGGVVGCDLLFALNQRIDENEPGNAMDQLTRIVGEITGAGGNVAGPKRVAIDQWSGAVEPGAGNPNAHGFFVYRTGADGGTQVDLEDPAITPILLGNYNSALYIQSRQTAETGLNHQRFAANVAIATGARTVGPEISRTIITGDSLGPWDWNGSGADAGGLISSYFGEYTDQSSSALDMW